MNCLVHNFRMPHSGFEQQKDKETYYKLHLQKYWSTFDIASKRNVSTQPLNLHIVLEMKIISI